MSKRCSFIKTGRIQPESCAFTALNPLLSSTSQCTSPNVNRTKPKMKTTMHGGDCPTSNVRKRVGWKGRLGGVGHVLFQVQLQVVHHICIDLKRVAGRQL
ncbi:hypothetical protein MGG_16440 [Pyricularia oryzae 70-15]|uniref:Uncharacterized protein n=1 Tax=Pyricularia oryzae (strain 70-15 / ATCC MYA-4617 / FGSC 8958) TaxID=242507 RepID=G4MP04_PYRO7|nr:uncharacterized protein MGG_16440 [Pyricularia oryzae 70-15]EHA57953.1 hypothetical protein MGG_16440 [Pyricularia oryzae 70-15]KAI7924382.1 hypothetical protein M9X92_003827 [Pyricularia oryzae]KAI7931364.1 hypothetical protein M0657_001318 [Pyricularia oryzae]